MRRVEILPSFFWLCEDCGHENHQREVEATEQERQEYYEHMREEMELEETEELPSEVLNCSLNTIPKTVHCKQCKSEFLTADPAAATHCYGGECDESRISWLIGGDIAVGTALGKVFIICEDEEGLFNIDVVDHNFEFERYDDQESALEACQRWLDIQ